MGFWDHIEELRKHIFWGVLWLILGCAVAGIYINELMEYVLLYPCPCETQIFITKDNLGDSNVLIVFGEHQFSDNDDNDETILHQHQLN